MTGMGASLRVLALLDPGHLYLLELALGRRLRIVREPGQLAHPAMQLREADPERIHVRMRRDELLGDVLAVVPGERHDRQSSSRRRPSSASVREWSMMRRAKGSVSRPKVSTA